MRDRSLILDARLIWGRSLMTARDANAYTQLATSRSPIANSTSWILATNHKYNDTMVALQSVPLYDELIWKEGRSLQRLCPIPASKRRGMTSICASYLPI
jgi:hypothetical protein